MATKDKAGPHGPWRLQKKGDQWCVANVETGDTGSGSRCHGSRVDALNQLRAMYASSPKPYLSRLLGRSKRAAAAKKGK